MQYCAQSILSRIVYAEELDAIVESARRVRDESGGVEQQARWGVLDAEVRVASRDLTHPQLAGANIGESGVHRHQHSLLRTSRTMQSSESRRAARLVRRSMAIGVGRQLGQFESCRRSTGRRHDGARCAHRRHSALRGERRKLGGDSWQAAR